MCRENTEPERVLCALVVMMQGNSSDESGEGDSHAEEMDKKHNKKSSFIGRGTQWLWT